MMNQCLPYISISGATRVDVSTAIRVSHTLTRALKVMGSIIVKDNLA